MGNSDTLSISNVWADMIQMYKHNKNSYVEVPRTKIFSPEFIQTCLKNAQGAVKTDALGKEWSNEFNY